MAIVRTPRPPSKVSTAFTASAGRPPTTAAPRTAATSPGTAPAATASSGLGKASAASTPSGIALAAAPGKRKITFASDSPMKPMDRNCLFELFVSKRQRALCVTVQEYLKDEPVLESVAVPGSKQQHKIVRGPNRSCSKGIVKWIIKMKQAGWSLNGNFDGTHFFITPLGTIKVCKTRMKYLVPATKSSTKSDMRAVADIIFCSVFFSCPNLPHESNHLLFLLRRFKEKYMVLLDNHPSGMTDIEKLSLFNLLYLRFDMLKAEDPQKHAEIIARMPHCKPGKLHWMKKIVHQYYLRSTLYYKNPLSKKKKETIKKKKNSAVSVPAAGAHQPGSSSAQPPTLLYKRHGGGMLRLLRNGTQHLPTEMAVTVLKFARRGRPVYVHRLVMFKLYQIEHMITQTLPKVICRFQKVMHSKNEYELLLH